MARQRPGTQAESLERIADALENHCRFERLELRLERLERLIIMSVESLQEKLDRIAGKTSEMAVDVRRIRSVLQELRDAQKNGASPAQLEVLNAKADEVLAATESLDVDLEQTGTPEDVPADPTE